MDRLRAVLRVVGVVWGGVVCAGAVQVEAEAFARMSGVVVEDKGETSDSLGYLENGDWADYVVTVPEAGEYRMSFRVASNTPGGDIEVVVGGSTVATATVVDTNGWTGDAWVTVFADATFSRAGRQTLRLNFVGSDDYSLYNLDWFAFEIPERLVLTVGDEPRQQMRYGLDYERLWFWYGSTANKRQVAQWSMVDCDVDYIRVAINSAYELEEGTYDLRAYTNKIIPMMTEMKRAKPDIKFFASPRPLNEAIDGARWQPYPRWITGDNGSSFSFKWQKCAEYLVRYVELMKSYGFKISFMDLTNEWNFVTPTHCRDIAEYMKRELAAEDMPLIIAPSTWSYAQGRSWLNGVNTTRRRNAIDIAASHNTDKTGTAQGFADRVREIWPGEDTEIWNTELHGWKGKNPSEEIPTSSFMFETIRAGFSGINGWLAIGTTNQGHCYFLNNGSRVTRNVKYYIFQKLANTSNYGHALDVNQPDELAATAALVRDNLVTVWALNHSTGSVPVEIDLGGRTIAGSGVRQTRWHESLSLAGVESGLGGGGSDRFTATVDGGSLCCFEVPLAVFGAADVAVETREAQRVAVTLDGTGDGGAITYRLKSTPANGRLLGTMPDLTYTPNAGFVGEDTFTYAVRSGGAESAPATVTVTVRAGRLLAYWPCDDGVGSTITDVGGGGYHGGSFNGTWTGGYAGPGLEFDAGRARGSLPAGAFGAIGDQLSVAMWVRGDVANPVANSVLYALDAGRDRVLNIHLPWSDGKVYWDAGNDGGYDRISKTAGEAEYEGRWNHWVFCKDSGSGEMKIYLNGVLWASGTGKARPVTGIRTVFLGGQGSGASYDGKVDEVKLFNYALTGGEAAELYAGYPGRSGYAVWLDGFAGLGDVSVAGDPDGDGTATGIEYVLDGGDPGRAGGAVLPAAQAMPDGGVRFSFVRRAGSTADTVQVVQVGSDLEGWTDIPVSGDGAPASVTVQALGGGRERVTVLIDAGTVGAAGGEVYLRLKVGL